MSDKEVQHLMVIIVHIQLIPWKLFGNTAERIGALFVRRPSAKYRGFELHCIFMFAFVLRSRESFAVIPRMFCVRTCFGTLLAQCISITSTATKVKKFP